MSPALATALLLVGACPSGTISNAYTFLARGNTALSVTLTAISNLVAFVATPVALSVAGYFASAEIASSLTFPPGPLLRQLALSMVLPLALGIACRMRFPAFVLRNLKSLRRLCVFLIFAVVALTVLANPAEIGRQLKAMTLPVIIITPCLFTLAFAVTRAFHVGAVDRRAILFELPCRNVALAMLIALSVLQRPELAFMAMAFFILESVLLLILAAAMIRFPDSSPRDRADHSDA